MLEGHDSSPGSPPVILRWRRILERVSLVLGLALLALFAVAMIDRSASSRAAVRAVEMERPVAAVPSTDVSTGQDKAEPLGVLSIARLGVKAPVFDRADELSLNRGLGWIAGTAKPGEPGNTGIAGHRDSFFRPLKDAAVGDVLELRTRQSRSIYRVDEIKIVDPEDAGVLRTRGAETLTLVTCYPFYFVGDAPQRFVVHAKLENRAPANFVQQSGFPARGAANVNPQGVIQ